MGNLNRTILSDCRLSSHSGAFTFAPRFMKILAILAAIASFGIAHSAEVPEVFAGFFKPNTPLKAQMGLVLPPQEINKYIAKVEIAARKEPKWFREYSAASAPGTPLPYDERLGLTKEEYDEYLKLWAKRKFKGIEEIVLLLREGPDDVWTLSATGKASTLTTLRYFAKDDSFRSPNGALKRIADIKADPKGMLGAWSGQEWKFEEETGLGKTKENIAFGRYEDAPFGIIIYRAQELSSEGSRLLDKSMMIRFPLAKTPAAKPATKPKKN